MAEPLVPAGNYNIVNVAATSVALSVPAATRAGVRDGAIVNVESRNWADSQIFSLSYRSDADETAQLLNRLTGKSLSVTGTPAANSSIEIRTDTDEAAQQWVIEDAGSTVTIGGTSYPTYRIKLYGTSLYIAKDGSSAVKLKTQNTHKWAFVPIPDLASGGVYELVSFADRRRCLAIGASAMNDGAGACIYARLGINDQKWTLENTGAGWLLRNVNSGKIACVNAVTPAAGQPIVQWSEAAWHKLWSPSVSDTAELDGIQRRMVAFGIDNAQELMLTAITSNGGAALTAKQSYDPEYWMLVPTWAYDSRISAPYEADAVEAVGLTAHYDATAPWGESMGFLFVPTWRVPDALATSGPTSFQIRKRTRAMGADTSAWGSWGNWSDWESAPVTRTGDRYWLTEGLTATMPNTGKLAQVEYEVRTCVAVDGSLRYGGSATFAETCYPIPDVTFGASTFTPEGLAIPVTSAYDCGSVVIGFDSITAGGEPIIAHPVRCEAEGGAGTLVIPWEDLLYLPASGSTLEIAHSVGSDQKDFLAQGLSATSAFSYVSESGTPTVVQGDGLTLAVTPPAGNPFNWAWMVVDGRRVDIPANDDGTFSVLYPFGVPYTLCIAGTDGERFYVNRTDRTGEKGCHALNWKGGYVLIELREGEPLTTEDSIEAEYEAYILDSRPYETVSFAPTLKHHFDVNGAVTKSYTKSQRGDFTELAGNHVTYRSPAGDVCPVAVLSVKRTAHHSWTELDVSLVREG